MGSLRFASPISAHFRWFFLFVLGRAEKHCQPGLEKEERKCLECLRWEGCFFLHFS